MKSIGTMPTHHKPSTERARQATRTNLDAMPLDDAIRAFSAMRFRFHTTIAQRIAEHAPCEHSRLGRGVYWVDRADLLNYVTLTIYTAPTSQLDAPWILRVSANYIAARLSSAMVERLGLSPRCSNYFTREAEWKSEISVLPHEVASLTPWVADYLLFMSGYGNEPAKPKPLAGACDLSYAWTPSADIEIAKHCKERDERRAARRAKLEASR